MINESSRSKHDRIDGLGSLFYLLLLTGEDEAVACAETSCGFEHLGPDVGQHVPLVQHHRVPAHRCQRATVPTERLVKHVKA